jgi:site-specific DNA recombinase
MVWNRRKRSRPERRVSGRVNPPSEWVWSQQPTHEPLVTRALFDAATPVARIREGSRGGAGPNAAHPHTRRSYVLRSYVYCDICGRRMFGKTRRRGDRERTYYACVINREHHREQPWYPDHPTSALVREEPIMDAVGRFFAERVLGPGRHLYLRPSDQQTQPVERRDAAQRTALTARLDQLTRAQANLMAQLEAYTPTGDDEIDTEWRTALQTRFTTIAAERKTARSQLNALDAAPVPVPRAAGDELTLLANLPCTSRNLTLLPEAEQRQLYEAFHLQVRYNRATNQVTLRVTISAATVNGLAAVVHAAVDDTTPGTPTDDAPPPAISDDDGSHATGGMPRAHACARSSVTIFPGHQRLWRRSMLRRCSSIRSATARPPTTASCPTRPGRPPSGTPAASWTAGRAAPHRRAAP